MGILARFLGETTVDWMLMIIIITSSSGYPPLPATRALDSTSTSTSTLISMLNEYMDRKEVVVDPPSPLELESPRCLVVDEMELGGSELILLGARGKGGGLWRW